MPDVAYVTYHDDPADPDPDHDLAPAVAALTARGITARAHAWDDPVDWSQYRLVLVRSPWDYVPRREAFLAWARAVDAVARVVNPVPVLAANTDKTYLRDLERAGVPIVQTRWAVPGEPYDTWSLGLERCPIDVVVKPAVGAGARDTVRSTHPAGAIRHVAHLHGTGRTALVQPYQVAVDGEGEVSVVVLGGTVSHAVRKIPALTQGGHGDLAGPVPVTDELRGVVGLVAAAVPEWSDLAWARVDVVRDDAGAWRLMELELTEPLLFLGAHPDAPARFAEVVAGLLAGA